MDTPLTPDSLRRQRRALLRYLRGLDIYPRTEQVNRLRRQVLITIMVLGRWLGE